MKNSLFAFLVFVSFYSGAQTHVWGGIYSNTTWVKANSPYIVDSLLVVFPGVKLTIQPGVTVRFRQGVSMEVRQSTLTLVGTANDSIFFTSDASSPQAGDWTGVYLNGGTLGPLVQYLDMRYSDQGFYRAPNSNVAAVTDLATSAFRHNNFIYGFRDVSSSFFEYNGIALQTPKSARNCIFTNNDAGIANAKGLTRDCIFRNNNSAIMGCDGITKKCVFFDNQIGISSLSKGLANPVVDSCVFKHNVVGLRRTSYATIKNNVIDSNEIGIMTNGSDHIEKNLIRYNNTGINEVSDPDIGWRGSNSITDNMILDNLIGLEIIAHNDLISCNTICSNSTYNLKYTGTSNTVLSFAAKNAWCSNDSSHIASTIHDGYDNVTAGLVSFTPLDLAGCAVTIGIPDDQAARPLAVYPNPSTREFNIRNVFRAGGEIRVSDMRGRVVYSAWFDGGGDISFRLHEAPGVYICEVKGGSGISRQKIVLTE